MPAGMYSAGRAKWAARGRGSKSPVRISRPRVAAILAVVSVPALLALVPVLSGPAADTHKATGDRTVELAQAAQAAKPEGKAADQPPARTKKKKRKKSRGLLVQVDRVRKEPLRQTMPVIGYLVAVRKGPVAARLDAPVAEMKMDVGDQVRKGDVLALLVDDTFRHARDQKAAELAGARAAIDTARSKLALARQELSRIRELETSAAFSRARFDDKQVEVARFENEVIEARAKAKQVAAALKLAETQLRYTRIRAPYAGTITERHTEAGAFIKEGQPVYSMVSDQDLEVEADVPATRVGGLAPGTAVTFDLAGGATRIEAKVRAIVPQENQRTRTRTVRFVPRFKNRPEGLAAFQAVTVHLPLGKSRTVLSVNKDALVTSRGSPTVYVVESNRARERPIVIGEGIGGRFEVVSGLREGDVVVTRGNERLRDGRRVRVNKTVTQ